MTGPPAPPAARVAIAATMTARSNALLTSQARRGPRRTATESTPAAASRSLSALALAMASAAPAATATGTRMAKARGSVPVDPEPAEDRQQRDPDRERQPRPGRALGDEVVAVPDRQDDTGQSEGRRAGRDGQQEPQRGGDDHDHPSDPRRHETGGDRLAGLVARVAWRIDEVVERPDRDLQGGHRDGQAEGRRRIRAGDRRDRGDHGTVKDGGERVGQPDQATQSRRETRRVQPAGQT